MKECLIDKFVKIANSKTSKGAMAIAKTIPDDRLMDLIFYLHGCIISGYFRGWIPTDIAVPDDDRMVLVTAKTKKGYCSVNRAFYLNGSWHGSGSMSGVVAWMELPEPYEVNFDD